MGLETVRAFANHGPLRIYLAARTESKATAAIDALNRAFPGVDIAFLRLDLSSLASVREAASSFCSREKKLHVLVNNAGVMATPPGLSKDGVEIQFGTNHLGHFLLTQLLLPTILSTSHLSDVPPRIVTVSSGGHHLAPAAGLQIEGLTFPDGGALSEWQRYGQSKLANILFTRAMAEKYPAIVSVAVHPGMVKTDLYVSAKENSSVVRHAMAGFSNVFMKTVKEGAYAQLWAATSAKEVESGEFYVAVGRKFRGSALSRDQGLSKRLWEWSEQKVAESDGVIACSV